MDHFNKYLHYFKCYWFVRQEIFPLTLETHLVPVDNEFRCNKKNPLDLQPPNLMFIG